MLLCCYVIYKSPFIPSRNIEVFTYNHMALISNGHYCPLEAALMLRKPCI